MTKATYTVGTKLTRRSDGATCEVVAVSRSEHTFGTTWLYHVRLDDEALRARAGGDMVGQASWLSSYFKKVAVKVTVKCNECGKTWRVSPNADPQCPKCNSVDFEVR